MTTILNFVCVGIGGAIGACLRYSVSLALVNYMLRLPYATLLVNVMGALLAGFIATWFWHRGLIGSPLQLLLVVGFLGGFTTFSAFSVETLRFLEAGALGLAAWNIFLNVFGSLVGVFIGAYLTRLVPVG